MGGGVSTGRSEREDRVLGQRALNRALLARQLLLRRARMSPAAAIEHLVGLQAQLPSSPYVGLWTRLRGFRPQALSLLIQRRRAVRLASLRSTLHLLSARDCLALRPLLQPVLERGMNATYGRRLAGLELGPVVAAGRTLVDERPRTFAELGGLLHRRWPDRDPDALANAIRALVPLIQVPPRGLWGGSGLSLHTSAEAWLGCPMGPPATMEAVILRYLAAFGPATVQDMQTWSGLRELREPVERLRARLRTFRDASGRELFDSPRAPRPGPDSPAPPRFLPEFDNILLSHADRTRILFEEDRKRLMTNNGVTPGTVLIDGFVWGAWAIRRDRGEAALLVELFHPVPRGHRSALVEEGGELLAWVAPEVGKRRVRLTTSRELTARR